MAIRTKAEEAVQDAATAAASAAVHQNVVGIEQTTANVKQGMAQGAAGLETTQARMTEGVEKVIKTTEELVAFGQGNMEALVKSGQIWAAGVQDLSRQVAATAQASFEQTMSSFKALSSVTSLKEAMDLQSSLTRATIEKTLAESGRLTDASIRLTEQTMAPLTARVTLAVQKFSNAA